MVAHANRAGLSKDALTLYFNLTFMYNVVWSLDAAWRPFGDASLKVAPIVTY